MNELIVKLPCLLLRRGIESTNDKNVVLSTLFKILSSYDGPTKLDRPRRIFLWLDEIESLIYYPTRYHKPFTQALRELIDRTPRHLTFFMNFSFADTETISTLEFIIGKALIDRITGKVFFDELETGEALEYVAELLGFFRTDDFQNKNDYYPFAEDSLTRLFENLKEKLKEPLMPRTINKWCVKSINQAIQKKYFEQNKIIDENLIHQLPLFEEPPYEIPVILTATTLS